MASHKCQGGQVHEQSSKDLTDAFYRPLKNTLPYVWGIVDSWVSNVWGKSEVAIFQRTAANLRQRRLRVLRVLILPPNSTKAGDFRPEILYFWNKNILARRTFSGTLKLLGNLPPCCHDASNGRPALTQAGRRRGLRVLGPYSGCSFADGLGTDKQRTQTSIDTLSDNRGRV